MPVEPQNRTQFSANGTKGVEIRKLEMSFAPHWTYGNLPVRNSDVIEWRWGTLHQNVKFKMIKMKHVVINILYIHNNETFSWASCGPRVGHSRCEDTLVIMRRRLSVVCGVGMLLWHDHVYCVDTVVFAIEKTYISQLFFEVVFPFWYILEAGSCKLLPHSTLSKPPATAQKRALFSLHM